MIYGSVCSGIEAASVAWKPLGWKASFFSEIEKFPSAVLDHHYPRVPNLGDMTKFKEWPDAIINVLVGGTPCQSFSIAGLRKGLDDPRGNLMLTYLAIAARYRPTWLVWENVPGVLSSNGGRDFGTLLGGLGQLGYGFAYRILDAQHFGVPQRRRRVFVVGHLGDWRRAAAVLFERHSLSGNPAPSRETRKVTAGAVVARAGRNGGASNQDVYGGNLIAFGGNNTSGPIDVATAVNACGSASGRMDFESETFVTNSYAIPINTQVAMRHKALGERTGLGVGDTNDPSFTLQAGHSHAVAFAQNTRDEVREMAVAGALAAQPGMKQTSYIRQSMQVRRLTPRECERLQGFPDDYTLIDVRGKPAADGPRYKALGNSMAVPVMGWIGERINMVNQIDRRH